MPFLVSTPSNALFFKRRKPNMVADFDRKRWLLSSALYVIGIFRGFWVKLSDSYVVSQLVFLELG
jgi:hypothetical protein